jgi:hypothetical protein
MTTAKQNLSPQQSSNQEHYLIRVASPRVQSTKRKVQDDLSKDALSNQLMIGSRMFVCENVPPLPTNDPTFDKHAANAANAWAALAELKATLAGSEDGHQVSYFEPIHDPPASKKSKMHRVASMPSFSQISSDQLSANTMSVSAVLQLKARMSMSKSASSPSLPSMVQVRSEPLPSSRFESTKPDTHLHAILKSMNVSAQTSPSLELDDFFVTPTEEHIAAYRTDIITAVRQGDLPTLRQMHSEGRMMQCCNRFGESIIHMACRTGAIEIVRFLVEEAGVSFRVRDDYGRTPLHDACWTREPEIELVKMLISSCPDLLYLKDKRGFTPLAYVRIDHWGQWCEFLEENRHLLIPSELL